VSSEAAAEATRQLRQLTACGYPLSWLAQYTRISPTTLYGIRAGHRAHIWHDTAELINTAHHALHDTNPADHGITYRAIGTALRTAGRNGWTTTRKDTDQ
jgi:hypothetical protein